MVSSCQPVQPRRLGSRDFRAQYILGTILSNVTNRPEVREAREQEGGQQPALAARAPSHWSSAVVASGMAIFIRLIIVTRRPLGA